MGLRSNRATPNGQASSSTLDGSGQSNGNAILGAFGQLYALLREGADFDQIDALVLLQPFLDVIRSGDTSGPITATALSSVDKIVTYGLVHAGSPNLETAMAAISNAGTHCKFEASDSASDEVVLLKILDVLKNTLTSPLGAVLTDEAVCEIMETGLSMCCQMRLSEMLRRSAERTMQALVASVFGKLQTIDEAEDAVAVPPPVDDIAPLDGAAAEGVRMAAPDPTSGSVPAASTPLDPSIELMSPKLVPADAADTAAIEKPKPYGLPSIRELLRVLISLLNPHDAQHTDTMRAMALNILNIAIEMGGRSIGRFPSLRSMVADELCKHLLQLARSENQVLFAGSLRVIATVLDTMRVHLKLQQELFLAYVMERLARPGDKGLPEPWTDGPVEANAQSKEKDSPPVTLRREAPPLPSESREILLERLAQLARSQTFIVDLWTNYDCAVDCEDVAQRTVSFFARGVFPSHSGGQYLQDASQLLCLDTILLFVSQLASRLDQDENTTIAGEADIRAAKGSKRLLIEGSARFNKKPKDGLRFLEENQIIYADSSMSRPESLARFLKSSSRLDKAVLGDFISRPDQLDVLKAFMRLFDFNGILICDALRQLLEAFRLPGESQQIARITETFAEVYFESKPAEIKSTDATYVLSYSVIMLNTDQHNPQNRKRMTVDDYKRNLRGVNDGSDFSPAFLKSIYDSIRRREIVMPEEHLGQLGFEYAWRELLRRSQSAGPFSSLPASPALDRDLFAVVWKPLVASIAYAFAHFQDDALLQRAIAGFRQCSELASRYEMTEVFDYTIAALARVTGLAIVQLPDSANFPTVQTTDGQSITVSPLSTRFGANFKAQLAAVVLFSIANNHGQCINAGWTPIFEIYNTLFVHSLLPASLLSMDDFLAGSAPIPLKPKTTQTRPRDAERRDGGLLSTLSSYLLSPYGPATPETMGRDVTDEDVEHTLCTVDCIASCRVEDLHQQILKLPTSVLVGLVQSLVRLAERHTVERTRSRALSTSQAGSNGSSRDTTPPSTANGPNAAREPLAYDPSSVFLLELIVSITTKADAAIEQTWPVVFELLSRILATSHTFSALLIERVVVALLRLASVIARHDQLHDQLFLALDALRSLSLPVLISVADQLAAGLSKVVAEHSKAIKTATEWSLVLSLLAATASRDDAARHSFALVSSLVKNDLLTAENFAPFVHCLEAFIAAAGARDLKSVDGTDDPMVERAKAALELLRESPPLVERLVKASSLPRQRAWEAFWLPVLSVYAAQSTNACRDVRQLALASLQRTLVSPEVLIGGGQEGDGKPAIDLNVVFERLIFPTIDELLKPQVFRRDPGGMGETRLRASALLCKIFLHHLTALEKQGMSGMTALWVRIIGCLDRMMHSGRRDHMYEAVPEQLKNVLLVMQSTGTLVPPHEPRTEDQAKLYDATWSRLDTFLPQLQKRPEAFNVPVTG